MLKPEQIDDAILSFEDNQGYTDDCVLAEETKRFVVALNEAKQFPKLVQTIHEMLIKRGMQELPPSLAMVLRIGYEIGQRSMLVSDEDLRSPR